MTKGTEVKMEAQVMNKWIRCTGEDLTRNEVPFLNIGLATYITRTKTGSQVVFSSNDSIDVEETPEELMERLSGLK